MSQYKNVMYNRIEELRPYDFRPLSCSKDQIYFNIEKTIKAELMKIKCKC